MRGPQFVPPLHRPENASEIDSYGTAFQLKNFRLRVGVGGVNTDRQTDRQLNVIQNNSHPQRLLGGRNNCQKCIERRQANKNKLDECMF
jgi:hypothetical protein